MRRLQLLLTNDDGIDAEGLCSLARVLGNHADVFVVSPELERSAMSHAITMHKPLHADLVSSFDGAQKAWRINGTPSDCVKLGVEILMAQKPDLVLSGVNHGTNLGRDIYYSGTVSAAMEGMFLGIPSIALSYDGHDKDGLGWAAEFTHRWIYSERFQTPPTGILYNVNFPRINHSIPAAMRWVKLGRREYANDFHKRMDPRGREYFWLAGHPQDIREAIDTDVGALMAGDITITPLHMDATAYGLMPESSKIDLDDFSD